MKPAKKTRAEATAIVGAGTELRGRISGDEDLTVLGRIEGEIDLGRAALSIEKGAAVRADVRAGSVRVSGAVVGNLTAAGLIHLSATARVAGDLRCTRLVIEPGAQVAGQVDVVEEDALAPRRGFAAPEVEAVAEPRVVPRMPPRPDLEPVFPMFSDDEPELELEEHQTVFAASSSDMATEPPIDRKKKLVVRMRRRTP